MSDRPHPSPASLDLLIREIKATPQEHWDTLLQTLRQFRAQFTPTPQPVLDPEQAQKNQAAIALLQSWQAEETQTDSQTWDYLKTALDQDRLSDRPLFP